MFYTTVPVVSLLMEQYVDLGPGPNQHTWGAVLLSKVSWGLLSFLHNRSYSSQFPILESTHHLLPSPHGELAPAIVAVLDMYGTNVTVVVAHNGQGNVFTTKDGQVAADAVPQRRPRWTVNCKPSNWPASCQALTRSR